MRELPNEILQRAVEPLTATLPAHTRVLLADDRSLCAQLLELLHDPDLLRQLGEPQLSLQLLELRTRSGDASQVVVQVVQAVLQLGGDPVGTAVDRPHLVDHIRGLFQVQSSLRLLQPRQQLLVRAPHVVDPLPVALQEQQGVPVARAGKVPLGSVGCRGARSRRRQRGADRFHRHLEEAHRIVERRPLFEIVDPRRHCFQELLGGQLHRPAALACRLVGGKALQERDHPWQRPGDLFRGGLQIFGRRGQLALALGHPAAARVQAREPCNQPAQLPGLGVCRTRGVEQARGLGELGGARQPPDAVQLPVRRLCGGQDLLQACHHVRGGGPPGRVGCKALVHEAGQGWIQA